MEKKPKQIKTTEICLLCLSSCCVVLLLITVALQIRTTKLLKEIKGTYIQTSTTANGFVPITPQKANLTTQVQAEMTQQKSTQKATESALKPHAEPKTETKKAVPNSDTVVINTKTKKMHSPDCSYAQKMHGDNRAEISISEYDTYIKKGYTPCARCHAGQGA